MRRSLEEMVVDLTSAHPWVRVEAARALAEMRSPRAVDVLLATVQAMQVRRSPTVDATNLPALAAAVSALGESGDERAFEAVAPFLSWAYPYLVCAAAEALGRLGNVRAVGCLLEVLDRDEAESRSAAAYALGELRSPEAVRPLIRALGDPSDEVRVSVAGALTAMGERRLVDAVEAMLGGSTAPAADDERIVLPLVRALAHPDREPRRLAAQALAGVLPVTEDAVVEGIGEADEGERYRLAEGLAEVGAPIVRTLAALLGRPEGTVRCVAAEALGRVGAPAAGVQDRLRAVARERDAGSRELRDLCQDALWRISVALSRAPAELEASRAPAGTGLEPEAAMPPHGRGTEPESAGTDTGGERIARVRKKWWR